MNRLPVLRRRDGRHILHRRLGEEAWFFGELGVGVGATLALGLGGANGRDAEGCDGSASPRLDLARLGGPWSVASLRFAMGEEIDLIP